MRQIYIFCLVLTSFVSSTVIIKNESAPATISDADVHKSAENGVQTDQILLEKNISSLHGQLNETPTSQMPPSQIPTSQTFLVETTTEPLVKQADEFTTLASQAEAPSNCKNGTTSENTTNAAPLSNSTAVSINTTNSENNFFDCVSNHLVKFIALSMSLVAAGFVFGFLVFRSLSRL